MEGYDQPMGTCPPPPIPSHQGRGGGGGRDHPPPTSLPPPIPAHANGFHSAPCSTQEPIYAVLNHTTSALDEKKPAPVGSFMQGYSHRRRKSLVSLHKHLLHNNSNWQPPRLPPQNQNDKIETKGDSCMWKWGPTRETFATLHLLLWRLSRLCTRLSNRNKLFDRFPLLEYMA